MRRAILRVDGNSKIGLGHIYRGLALAEMLKDDYLIEFVTRTDTTISPLQESGFHYSFIPDTVKFVDEPNWLNENYSKETIIIIDGYDFNQKYQRQIKDLNFKLVYIDDLVKGIQQADLVINHSPWVKKHDYKTAAYTKLALGIDYAVLRPRFLEASKKNRKITKIDSAFICFGGSDVHDLTLKVTKALLNIKQFKRINIVIGASYLHQDIFKLKEHYDKIKIYRNLAEIDLIRIMMISNFAIVPASTVLFELFCIKIPIYSGYFVENQKRAFHSFRDLKLVSGDGNFLKLSDKKLLKSLEKFIDLPDHKVYLKNQKRIIDGKQQQRHLKLINNLLQ